MGGGPGPGPPASAWVPSTATPATLSLWHVPPASPSAPPVHHPLHCAARRLSFHPNFLSLSPSSLFPLLPQSLLPLSRPCCACGPVEALPSTPSAFDSRSLCVHTGLHCPPSTCPRLVARPQPRPLALRLPGPFPPFLDQLSAAHLLRQWETPAASPRSPPSCRHHSRCNVTLPVV